MQNKVIAIVIAGILVAMLIPVALGMLVSNNTQTDTVNRTAGAAAGTPDVYSVGAAPLHTTPYPTVLVNGEGFASVTPNFTTGVFTIPAVTTPDVVSGDEITTTFGFQISEQSGIGGMLYVAIAIFLLVGIILLVYKAGTSGGKAR